jgi:hypothetical protein
MYKFWDETLKIHRPDVHMHIFVRGAELESNRLDLSHRILGLQRSDVIAHGILNSKSQVHTILIRILYIQSLVISIFVRDPEPPGFRGTQFKQNPGPLELTCMHSHKENSAFAAQMYAIFMGC